MAQMLFLHVLHEDQENGLVTFAFLRELNRHHEFSRGENLTIYWIIEELLRLYLDRGTYTATYTDTTYTTLLPTLH